jgi:hypothetical protein
MPSDRDLPPFLTRLRERLSPRTWALEWLALALALLGLVSQALPGVWPMSQRERLLLEGETADATVHAVARFNMRNTRWGTDKKIGATLPVYLLNISWRDERGRQHAVTGYHLIESDAAKLGLNRNSGETGGRLRIRYLPLDDPALIEHDRRELEAELRSTESLPPCRPFNRCERLLIDELNTFNAKKFGDRPEAGLTIVGLLVFAAMLAVRAIGLIILG